MYSCTVFHFCTTGVEYNVLYYIFSVSFQRPYCVAIGFDLVRPASKVKMLVVLQCLCTTSSLNNVLRRRRISAPSCCLRWCTEHTSNTRHSIPSIDSIMDSVLAVQYEGGGEYLSSAKRNDYF